MLFSCLRLLLFVSVLLSVKEIWASSPLSGPESTTGSPAVEWQKNFGGSLSESVGGLISLPDGNYLIAGGSGSANGDLADEPLARGHNTYNAWLLKVSPDGRRLWSKEYALFPYAPYRASTALDVAITPDGGYIVAGWADNESGQSIAWLFKVDANGNKRWEQSFPPADPFVYRFTKLVIDGSGNCVVTGLVIGPGNALFGLSDVWLLKFDPNGQLLWQKTFGGSHNDLATSLVLTNDGGYVISGYTASDNGDVTKNRGSFDVWVLKVSAAGSKVWQKTFGGSYNDRAMSVLALPDGGFAVAAYTSSGDGDVTGYRGPQPPLDAANAFFGRNDFWLLRLDHSGNLLWQKTYGGFNNDMAFTMTRTADDALVVAGITESTDGDVTGYHPSSSGVFGRIDIWVIKVNATGQLIWQRTLGGSGDDAVGSWFNDRTGGIVTTADGKYLIAGSSNSADGDVTQPKGEEDIWLIKLSFDGCATVANGAWDSPAVWSCGRIPAEGDAVQINHRITVPVSYGGITNKITFGSTGWLALAPGSVLHLTK